MNLYEIAVIPADDYREHVRYIIAETINEAVMVGKGEEVVRAELKYENIQHP